MQSNMLLLIEVSTFLPAAKDIENILHSWNFLKSSLSTVVVAPKRPFTSGG